MNTAAGTDREPVSVEQERVVRESGLKSTPHIVVEKGALIARLLDSCGDQGRCSTCPENNGWVRTCSVQRLLERIDLFNKAMIPATFVRATMELVVERRHHSPFHSSGGDLDPGVEPKGSFAGARHHAQCSEWHREILRPGGIDPSGDGSRCPRTVHEMGRDS